MPIVVAQGNRTKMITAKVVTSNGVVDYAVEVAQKMVERLGYKSVILRSDHEPAISSLKEVVRR